MPFDSFKLIEINTNKIDQAKKLRYYVHYIYLIDIDIYEHTYSRLIYINKLVSLDIKTLYLTIIDSMVEGFIYYLPPYYQVF